MIEITVGGADENISLAWYWCLGNLGKPFQRDNQVDFLRPVWYRSSINRRCFRFRDEDSAIAFKLIWG